MGYGKVLYRTATLSSQTWGAWQYKSITPTDMASMSLYFGKGHIQIVVIHEVQEIGKGLRPDFYYQLKGIYRFSIY